MYSLFVMIKCRWLEFRREPSAFYYVILFPIISIVGLGFIFNSPQRKAFPIGIDSKSQFSSPLYEIRANPEFKVIDGSRDDLEKELKRGHIQLILQLTQNEAQFYYDPRNGEAYSAKLAVSAALEKAAGQSPKFLPVDTEISDMGLRYVDFLIPGLLAFSIVSTSLFGTGQLIVANRRDNLLKRYFVTPMKPMNYMASHIVGRLLILAMEIAVVLLSGWLIFGFKVQGSLFTFIIYSVLGAAAFTSLGLLAASRTSNSSAYAGIVNAIVMPMALMGGVWFSRGSFPDWLVRVTDYFPLTILVDTLRAISLEGAGFAPLWETAAPLLLMTTLCALLASRLFKWY